MSDFTAEVIRYIRRKTASGFNEPITYLGSEQRFVSAMRNSSLNNLEEQFLIGTDTYKETYTDDEDNIVTNTEFHRNIMGHNNKDYYRLQSIQYKDGKINEDFLFKGNQLVLPDDPNELIIDKEVLKGENRTTFSFKNEVFQIFPSTYTIIRIDELYFVRDRGKSPSEDVHVATKITGKKILENGKQIFRENIINHIKPRGNEITV